MTSSRVGAEWHWAEAGLAERLHTERFRSTLITEGEGGTVTFARQGHLFPDLPSNRYAEIAPTVQEICSRYGLSYTAGSLPRQVGSAWKQVIKLSLPNDFSIHDTAKRVLRRRPERRRYSGTEAVLGESLRHTFPKSSEAPLARLSMWLCGCAELMVGSRSPARS